MTARSILEKLVSFPILGGQPNLEIISWLQDFFESRGVTCHLNYNEDRTKANMHCRIGPAVDGGVILSGHTDVVPVEGQPWDTDPFVLTEKDGKLFARGSCDMKGFLACCMSCVPEMLEADLKRPIYFAFSYDEEIGCLGAPALVQDIIATYNETPKFAIIGEATMLEPVVGQKGICIYETTVNGSAGHSSRIKQEVSAIHEATRLILWLENKMNQLIGAGHTDDRFEPNHTSLHVGTVKAGIAPNVIADHCSFHWDVRVIPQDSVQSIVDDFNAYCRERENILRDRFPGFRIVNKEHHPPVPPLDTPENLEIVDLIKKISVSDKLGTVAYAAEAGQFAEGGFQAVICGPGSIAQAHRANEFIAVDQLNKGVDLIKKLIVELEK